LVATIQKWKEYKFLRKDEITKIILYVDNNKVIYCKTEGNARKEKKVRVRLKEDYNVDF
jgi:hypothetical protein